jgi:hypothetical protein
MVFIKATVLTVFFKTTQSYKLMFFYLKGQAYYIFDFPKVENIMK